MMSDSTTVSRRKYCTLVDAIEAGGWAVDGERPVQRLLDGATGQNGEVTVTFSLQGTDTRLRLTVPDRTQMELCRVGLVNPLDRGLGFLSNDSTFVQDLSEVHLAIGQRHQTPYLDPVADPSVVFRGRIPTDFDDAILSDTIQACVQAGREVDRCHSLIYEILETYAS